MVFLYSCKIGNVPVHVNIMKLIEPMSQNSSADLFVLYTLLVVPIETEIEWFDVYGGKTCGSPGEYQRLNYTVF